ncbi:MAG: beta-lactamase family protein, partial [Spirochaetaceae bacterium]|nr:beta-lactamase family protein [Spirochaetaceae bacterium]
MIRRSAFIVVAAAVFLIGGCGGAPDVPQPEEGIPVALGYIHRYAENAAGGIKDGGLGVVVVADGEVVLIEGFGSADEASNCPVTADTVFRIGSITKLFTAFAVMQLIEDGLVDLDEPYATYVSAFSIRTHSQARAITVRDMLTHHAGLPGDIFRGWAGAANEQPDSKAAYRDYPALLSGQYTTSVPDTVFSYSNVAFSLLGILVEEVSGTPYSEYVQSHILRPLGMESSGLYAEETFADRMATGYASGNNDPDMLSHIRDIPAGSMYASLQDMGAFMQMIVKEGTLPGSGLSGGEVTIVDPATFAEMGRRQNASVALDFDFSIGLAFWLTNPTPIPD